MSELPEGWVQTTVKELAGASGLFVDGDWVESKDQDPNGDIRLLQLADIGDGAFLDKSDRWINEDAFTRLRCTQLVAGDVLIARMPDPMGRSCLMPALEQRCVTVVDVAALRVDPEVANHRWVMHTINAPQLRAEIGAQASGTTRKRISRGNLGRIHIPLPPEAEQKRIADKLDTVLNRVDAVNTRLARVAPVLRRFRQSVLAAATSGQLTEDWRVGRNLPEWTSTCVGNLVERIEAGLNVKCLERPPSDGERGLVKISAVTWGRFDEAESKTLPPSTEVRESVRIRAGDFLISRANTLELVGACVIVHAVERRLYLSDKVLRLEMPNQLKPWLLFVLRSNLGRKQIEATASGNQLSMRNLSQSNLRAIRVPLPSSTEIAEIVRRVETLFTFADRLEARLQAAQTGTERLTPALLAKAFRGELVPQDPSDEPASELLRRLWAERPANEPKRGRKAAA